MSRASVRRHPRMDGWRRRFTRILLVFTLAINLPWGVLLADVSGRVLGAGPGVALALLAIAFINLPLVYRLWHFREDVRSHWAHVWLADMPFFVHWCAALFFAPFAYLSLAGAGVASLLGLLRPVPSPARYLAPLYVLALVLALYATLVRRFWTRIRRVEVPVEGLAPELDSYTLVHLSDVHCGPYMPRWQYRALARRASTLGGDAIVVTGDLISSGAGYLDDVRDFFAHLVAPDGVFACMGNHDYFGLVDEVADAARAGGARVLRNEGLVVAASRRGAGLYLAGVDDNWSKRDDLDAALAGRDPALPCVLLAHDPALFPRVAARGDVDLLLSGHTHAGQFALPFMVRRYNLAALRERYSAGAYRKGRTALYVHAGNGTSGPPARLGAAPEIVCLVLRRAH